MADIQHASITSNDCHEPKHISTSLTSQAGMVITPSSTTAGTSSFRRLLIEDLDIDNSASGELNPYGVYIDTTYQESSPLAITALTRTKVVNNGGAATSVEVDMPAGASFWDDVDSKLTPVQEQDCYSIMVQFKAEPATANQYVTLELDIGGAQPILVSESKPLLAGVAPNSLTFNWTVPCSSTFLTNGGELYLTPSDDIDLWDLSLNVVRIRKGGA